ncbi:hypothetical protein TRICI_003739 [Trichomonascus ciferrii]|uniref:Ribosome biogenesis regulatory protein n=1 Tax=Trichomonascus ciferrii TaxID=44093 RepID=A0A642V2U4_9ASCO|nr:hypothetical protein TRICI_003739 [Trichomonascus ciferrii]
MSGEKSSTTVEKTIPVNYDFGNLAVFDTNPLDSSELDSDLMEVYFTSVARDNVQLLINQILQLPVQKTTDSNSSSGTQDSTMALFNLPQPTTALPREKPLPKPKAPTKWERFAAEKGIQKKAKDGKLVYDEDTGSWVPKWGYGGKNKQLDDQWLVEVDDKPKKQGDELIDPRTLNRAERKRLIKKNQRRQEKNAKGVTK